MTNKSEQPPVCLNTSAALFLFRILRKSNLNRLPIVRCIVTAEQFDRCQSLWIVSPSRIIGKQIECQACCFHARAGLPCSSESIGMDATILEIIELSDTIAANWIQRNQLCERRTVRIPVLSCHTLHQIVVCCFMLIITKLHHLNHPFFFPNILANNPSFFSGASGAFS